MGSVGETPGRGRGRLFWVSRGYVWISQGQKRDWKVGSGALWRKGLLKGCLQSSFLPPEEKRKKEEKEKAPLIHFSLCHWDLRTCLNTVVPVYLGYGLARPACTNTYRCICATSLGSMLPVAVKDDLNFTKKVKSCA